VDKKNNKKANKKQLKLIKNKAPIQSLESGCSLYLIEDFFEDVLYNLMFRTTPFVVKVASSSQVSLP
jgi:hypothetical protein